MSAGGARPGAGRPRGRRSSKSVEQLAAIAGTGLTPLEYLLNMMRDERQTEEKRLDAAKAAAPYVHPKLANIEATHKGDAANPIVISATDGKL